MDVIVLGAGIIGVTTAWYLRGKGHNVRVLERREQVGLDASFASAGHVSAHLADPWANPTTLNTLFTWLFSNDTPLVFRPKADIHQWSWLFKFLRECPANRYNSNLINLANLGVYSRTALQSLRAQTGIGYDEAQRGILQFFTDETKLQGAAAAARRLAGSGLRREVFDAEQCLEVEPALHSLRDTLKGGIYSRYDETGDAFKFTQRLTELACEAGVQFDYGSTVQRIQVGRDTIQAIDIQRANGQTESCKADQYVLCLGAESAPMARKIGINLDIYPVKGYSVSLPVREGAQALTMGLTDAVQRMAFSRLGNRVRGAAIAEITGYDRTVDAQRCQKIVANAQRLFPDALDIEHADYWAGLRPMSPSNLPSIGRNDRYHNLLINAGHGTMGWTQSCGSALAISDIIDGRRPDCEFPFIGEIR
ncbi:D-amino acid dehydrogenase [Alcaligenaceae bacterium]|nr:D-amino acid dehydrogenase [Alcaligenaceae bacterium]